MFNFEKLTVKAKHQLKKHLYISLLMLALTVGTVLCTSLLSQEVARLKIANRDYLAACDSLNSLNTQLSIYEETIKSNTATIAENFMTKEEFVTFIGTACAATGCDLGQLQGGDTTTDNGVTKIGFIFEVKGTSVEVTKFVQKIQGLNTRYMLKDISLRKTDDFLWLDRKKLDEFNLSWWDISNHTVSLDSPEEQLLTLDGVYGSNDMSLYLDVDFITAEVGK